MDGFRCGGKLVVMDDQLTAWLADPISKSVHRQIVAVLLDVLKAKRHGLAVPSSKCKRAINIVLVLAELDQ